MTVEPSKANPKPLSETECDRKAMLFWNGAGNPVDQYPNYRKAVELWSLAGAIEGEFDHYLQELRAKEKGSNRNIFARLPHSIAWPWITALVIPVLAVAVVFVEIQANRTALQNTFKVQAEEKRQSVWKRITLF